MWHSTYVKGVCPKSIFESLSPQQDTCRRRDIREPFPCHKVSILPPFIPVGLEYTTPLDSSSSTADDIARNRTGEVRKKRCISLLLFILANGAFGAEPVQVSAPFSCDEAMAYQQAWAKHLQMPVKITNSTGMTLALIPPGTSSMGSPSKEEWHRDDELLHRVKLSKPFYIGTTEVTQKQWKAFMGENPSFCTGDELPVETVTWQQAVEFF